MALTDESGGGIPATMLVGPANIGGSAMPYPYPMMMGGQGNGGFGNGQDGWWIILLIIIIAAAGNGFGNNNNGGGAFGGGQPIIINDGNNGGGAVQRGFDQAAIMSGIGALQSGVQNLATQLCSCCCDMRDTVSSGFYNAEIAASNRQMANMNQAFANQQAMSQGFWDISRQFSDCCCENRLATCQTQNVIQREGSETRFADANNTRDIIQSQTRGTQVILDKLCQLELDGKNDRIADLERQLTFANLQASQTAQTAQLERGQLAATTALVNELRSCPIPSQPVYGSQPIFTCPNNNNGCGCGCNGNF